MCHHRYYHYDITINEHLPSTYQVLRRIEYFFWAVVRVVEISVRIKQNLADSVCCRCFLSDGRLTVFWTRASLLALLLKSAVGGVLEGNGKPYLVVFSVDSHSFIASVRKNFLHFLSWIVRDEKISCLSHEQHIILHLNGFGLLRWILCLSRLIVFSFFCRYWSRTLRVGC